MVGLYPGGSAYRGCWLPREGQVRQTPPPRALQDMVNKRVVRILLEYILVSNRSMRNQ